MRLVSFVANKLVYPRNFAIQRGSANAESHICLYRARLYTNRRFDRSRSISDYNENERFPLTKQDGITQVTGVRGIFLMSKCR